MEQALKKRYDRDLDEDKIPDIIFIDGGKGQLNRALEVFHHLNVKWDKKPTALNWCCKRCRSSSRTRGVDYQQTRS